MPGSSVRGTAFSPSGSATQMSREPFSSETKSSFRPSGEMLGWYSSFVPCVSCRSPEPSAPTFQMLRVGKSRCFASLRREWNTSSCPPGSQAGIAFEPVPVTRTWALPTSAARTGSAAARVAARPSPKPRPPLIRATLAGRAAFENPSTALPSG